MAVEVAASTVTREPHALPLITLDFDGVICSPPFGLNLGIRSDFLDPLAPPLANVPPRMLSEVFDYLRFNFRHPLRDVAQTLRMLTEFREIVVLTGRRTSPLAWLRRYDLDRYVERIVINDTDLKSPHFKLQLIEALRPNEHVDDDGRTAQLIAQANTVGTRIYLCDWPRNRRDGYAPAVTRVANLRAVVDTLR